MRAGLANREAQLGAWQRRRHHRSALGAAQDIGGADVGALVEPESENAVGIRARRVDQPVAMRAVMRDDRGAVALESLKYLPLGVGDRLLAREIFAVRRGDGGDDRDMWPHQSGEPRQFACVVHPHFEHAVARFARHPRKAQRHSGVVVVALDRAMRPPRRRPVERRIERLLGAGLSDRTGDPDDSGIGPRTRRPTEIAQRLDRVSDMDVRVGNLLADHRAGRAGRESLLDEAVAIGRLALHRDEQVARPDLA